MRLTCPRLPLTLLYRRRAFTGCHGRVVQEEPQVKSTIKRALPWLSRPSRFHQIS